MPIPEAWGDKTRLKKVWRLLSLFNHTVAGAVSMETLSFAWSAEKEHLLLTSLPVLSVYLCPCLPPATHFRILLLHKAGFF